jgi:hypothetical protein
MLHARICKITHNGTCPNERNYLIATVVTEELMRHSIVKVYMMVLYIGKSYKLWISTPRHASLYYAGRGHICKLRMWYKNFKIMRILGYNIYCHISL